ncbi:hypothetical protein [Halobiforma nitratireducens]|uniref:Uncharacterized protein n=1 Tax=Halobiforma nitratireducens JCM 10879 TaxID=1227454 RepID=M0M7U1_9EURY|nr:hypothetical protein [Halobiforma nitratireducens]EMA41877.1 hypothetical protein C446_04690 [Halobiforma nitratireducens JCM 10879]
MSRLTKFAELRRALPLAAAALLLVALALPMWRITLEAPQYPDGLFVELYAYPRLEGDVGETQALNQYVGFYYPDPVFLEPNYEVQSGAIEVPEWSAGPLAFVAVAATGVFVALAPTVRKLKFGLSCQLAGTATVFVVMFAAIQYRLYQAGHTLDPDAPMRGVDPFTPPLLGTYEIANISGLAWFGPGGYLTMIAFALLVVSFFLRDSTATVGDAPDLLRGVLGRLRERVRSGRGGDEADDDRSDRDTPDAVTESGEPATAGELEDTADATAVTAETDTTHRRGDRP